MDELGELLARFPTRPSEASASEPLRLASTVSGPATTSETVAAWSGRVLPDEIARLWRSCRTARLFVDVDFGQWGLVLLDPAASAARTRRELAERAEYRPDDVVIGELLGDQELLVFAPSETGRRRLLVALPLDPRSEWYGAAPGMVDFFAAFLEAKGAKYWEPHSRALKELFAAANRACEVGPSAQDFEPAFCAVLDYLQAHPGCRGEAAATMVRPGALEWELVAFLMHELRWQEVRDAALVAIARAHDFRIKTPLSHVVAAFEDDWPGAAMYRRFRRASDPAVPADAGA